MKYKNKLKRLEAKQIFFDKNPVIQKANQDNPGAYTRPGSINKR